MDGLSLMRRARELDPDSVTVVMTAYGALDTGMAAMRHGAIDYVTKPIHVEDLLRVIEPVLERRRAREWPGAATLAWLVPETSRIEPALRAVSTRYAGRAVARVGAISGESGTGKRLIAGPPPPLHPLDRRSSSHCAALPDSIESELFVTSAGVTARRRVARVAFTRPTAHAVP